MNSRQTAVATVVLLLPLMLAGFVMHEGALFHRPLWLDEYTTLLVSSQKTLSDVYASLLSGADHNPPLLFLWHWFLGFVAGGVELMQLRLTALVAVWLAVVGLYVLLRSVFGGLPALGGAILVAANGDVIKHAFDARFYGPWLFLVVLHIGVIQFACAAPRSMPRQALAGVSAVLLCTVHFFGVITLWLVTLGTAVARRNDRSSIRALLPAAMTGTAAIGAYLLLVSGTGVSPSSETWIARPSVTSSALFLMPSVCVAVLAVVLMRGTTSHSTGESEGMLRGRGVIYALMSLALLPLLVVVLSLVIQPLMVGRYALPSLLALGPVGAALFTRFNRSKRVALAMALPVIVIGSGLVQSAEGARFDARVRTDLQSVREAMSTNHAVVAAEAPLLYPLFSLQPDLASRVGLATVPEAMVRVRFPAGSDSALVGNTVIAVNSWVRTHTALFGIPRPFSVDSLQALPCFYMLDTEDEPDFTRRWLRDAQAVRIRPRLFFIRRQPRQSAAPMHSECGVTIPP